MSQWIKKDDKVLVLAGNDRGRTGVVLRKLKDRVVIQGVNIRKKHVKRRAQVQTPSIIEMEMPIPLSNVCLCDQDGKRINLKVRLSKGQKELYYVNGDKEIVLRVLRKK